MSYATRLRGVRIHTVSTTHATARRSEPARSPRWPTVTSARPSQLAIDRNSPASAFAICATSWPGSVKAPTTCSASVRDRPSGRLVRPTAHRAGTARRSNRIGVSAPACRSRCGSESRISSPPAAGKDQRVERAEQRRPAVEARHDLTGPQIRRAVQPSTETGSSSPVFTSSAITGFTCFAPSRK